MKFQYKNLIKNKNDFKISFQVTIVEFREGFCPYMVFALFAWKVILKSFLFFIKLLYWIFTYFLDNVALFWKKLKNTF